MNVKIKSFYFQNIVSSKFLFYAWVDLKLHKNYFYMVKYKKLINKRWFEKTANLIATSQFTYKKSFNINSITFLKNKIIENAILIFINSFINSKNKLRFNLPLTECVRKLIQ